MNITTAMIADYLTADFGSYLLVRADGTHSIAPAGTSFRGTEFQGCVKCPGLGNLDSSYFAEDFAQMGEDGVYRGEGFEGDLADLVRYACENGDVTVLEDDLSDALDASAADIARAEMERADADFAAPQRGLVGEETSMYNIHENASTIRALAHEIACNEAEGDALRTAYIGAIYGPGLEPGTIGLWESNNGGPVFLASYDADGDVLYCALAEMSEEAQDDILETFDWEDESEMHEAVAAYLAARG